MTEAVKPPLTPAKPDPITEGVQARLYHLREVIRQFSGELRELERLEKALLAAGERLDRHSHLMTMETQLLEQLLKREAKAKIEGKPGSIVPFVDHVEEAIATLTSGLGKAS